MINDLNHKKLVKSNLGNGLNKAVIENQVITYYSIKSPTLELKVINVHISYLFLSLLNLYI